MNRGKELQERLRRMSTDSNEFYHEVATYFWRRTRPNFNYGFFFILLAMTSLALAYVDEDGWMIVSWYIIGSCFAACLGAVVIQSALSVSRILTCGRNDQNPLNRLRQLRAVAEVYPGDVISAFVLALP